MPEKYYNTTSFVSLASQKIRVSLHMLIVLNESTGVTAVQSRPSLKATLGPLTI